MAWIIQHLLIVTFLMVIFAISLALLIFLGLTRHYGHDETRPQVGSALVSLVVAVLFSVILNNWYAVKRDRDNRLRAFRDQHLAQLKPVLRAESLKLAEIADDMKKDGHITQVDNYRTVTLGPNTMLWPDVMSQDLQRHFPEYDKSKRALLSNIESQDQEYRLAVALVKSKIRPRTLDPNLKDITAVGFVVHCLGLGPGIKLTVNEGGYNYEYPGVVLGGNGKPSPDQMAAFHAFQSLRPDTAISSHCVSLKDRADKVFHSADDLSRQALLLSETTVLKGTCDFVASDNLSD